MRLDDTIEVSAIQPLLEKAGFFKLSRTNTTEKDAIIFERQESWCSKRVVFRKRLSGVEIMLYFIVPKDAFSPLDQTNGKILKRSLLLFSDASFKKHLQKVFRDEMQWFDDFSTPRKCLDRLENGKRPDGDPLLNPNSLSYKECHAFLEKEI